MTPQVRTYHTSPGFPSGSGQCAYHPYNCWGIVLRCFCFLGRFRDELLLTGGIHDGLKPVSAFEWMLFALRGCSWLSYCVCICVCACLWVCQTSSNLCFRTQNLQLFCVREWQLSHTVCQLSSNFHRNMLLSTAEALAFARLIRSVLNYVLMELCIKKHF